MTIKLEIDDVPEDDNRYHSLRFRQEGFKGYLLELVNLHDFIEALESCEKDSTFFFYQDYGIKRTGTTFTVNKHAKKDPLLSLSDEQVSKLLLHLRSSYGTFV